MKEHGKSIALAVLAVILLGMTIAYAALQTNLNINGTVQTPQVSWDVHITGWNEVSKSAGVTYTGPTTTATSITNLALTLPKPGDTATFTFKIVNEGTINAKLNTITGGFTCTQSGGCSNIEYSLTCTNDAMQQNSILYAANDGTTDEATCTLVATNKAASVETGSTTYSQSAADGSFSHEWIYVQN